MRSILSASDTVSPKRTPTSEIEDLQRLGRMPTGTSAWTVALGRLEIRFCEFESCSKGSRLLRARQAARMLQRKTTRLRKRFSKLEIASLMKNCTTSFIERRVDSSTRAFDVSADKCYSRIRTTSRSKSTLSLWKMKTQKHLLATV